MEVPVRNLLIGGGGEGASLYDPPRAGSPGIAADGEGADRTSHLGDHKIGSELARGCVEASEAESEQIPGVGVDVDDASRAPPSLAVAQPEFDLVGADVDRGQIGDQVRVEMGGHAAWVPAGRG